MPVGLIEIAEATLYSIYRPSLFTCKLPWIHFQQECHHVFAQSGSRRWVARIPFYTGLQGARLMLHCRDEEETS